ncbi:MAG: Nif3-like dinuclear metal center hexameric protein [Burkholderiales bacterium]|nr:MAG: Nif3-like dinuclear metal center hexameric protein [Burkholderiales bacterium]
MTQRRGKGDRKESGTGRATSASAAAAVTAAELSACFEEILGASRFADYCPNGLQVEGERPIRRLVSGVTASLALVRAAIDEDADALLVHHGWFWRGEDPRVIGSRRERLGAVLRHGMHLFAYHLPLDVHPQLGNNAQLAARMGWRVDGHAGEQDLIAWHDLGRPASAAGIGRSLARRLGRRPLVVGALERPVRRLAWCTGAAQDMLQQAIDAGADAFVSGEIAERTTHLAREAGVVYFAAGHHATERYGVQALGEHVGRRLRLAHRFIDDDNPV